MSCGCGKHTVKGVVKPTIQNMKQDLSWSISRAEIIAKIREEDIQVYEDTHFSLDKIYEIEPINPNRNNIVKIVKWQPIQQI